MNCYIYPPNTLKKYWYVVILSFYQGQLVLSRHKQRTTWETQGGHIEPGETPQEAAARELVEESGAVRFSLEPIFDYAAGENELQGGMVFAGQIDELGPMPESEMAEISMFDALPEQLTYPGITPHLYRYFMEKCQS